MTTTTDWYAASLQEVSAFLDKYETRKQVTVKADDPLIAALVGLMNSAPIIYAMAQHSMAAVRAAQLLESELGSTVTIPGSSGSSLGTQANPSSESGL